MTTTSDIRGKKHPIIHYLIANKNKEKGWTRKTHFCETKQPGVFNHKQQYTRTEKQTLLHLFLSIKGIDLGLNKQQQLTLLTEAFGIGKRTMRKIIDSAEKNNNFIPKIKQLSNKGHSIF